MTTSISDLLSVAKETAVSAGTLTRDNFYTPREMTLKGFRDVVTDSDIAAQKVITSEIMRRFPTHGFMPEEENPDLPTEGDVIWIIDPIDGTTNFSRQLPDYCVSVAAAIDGKVVVGVIYDPMRNELFEAQLGKGAWLGDQKLSVAEMSLNNAIVSLDWSRGPDHRLVALDILNQLALTPRTIRCIGSAALATTWVAAGRVDAYFNLGLEAWDHAAAGLILREAGGRTSTCLGESEPLQKTSFLGSNGVIHDELVGLITAVMQTK